MERINSGLVGFFDAPTDTILINKFCGDIFTYYCIESALCKALDNNDPIAVIEFLNREKCDANSKLTIGYGDDVYTATPLVISIMYHALCKTDTQRCVDVLIMVRIVFYREFWIKNKSR
jgi:hypothetical protein